MVAQTYRFSAFVLNARGELLRDGVTVAAGGRAVSLLAKLLERAGELVTKQELMAAGWPGLIVDDGNLSVQIALLRQSLNDAERPHRLIATVPRRGYRFIGELTAAHLAPAAPPAAIPAAPHPMIGRDSELAGLQAAFARNRLVTLTGAGGLGKTRLAIAFAAEFMAADPRNQAAFLPLDTLHGPGGAVERIAGALGVSLPADRHPVQAVADYLRHAPRLLVLDNCEHVLDEVADLVGFILQRAPAATILATSRESLNLQSEHVVRLGPLVFPAAGAAFTALEALDYPAIRLLVDRADAATGGFALAPGTAALAGDICRRLDGIPLAIELAAPRLKQMSVLGLRDGLANQMRLLLGGDGAKNRPARQRTLEATIAWSHGLLTVPEQNLLHRLGVFTAGFRLDAAKAVAPPSVPPQALPGMLAALVDKSLVVQTAARGNFAGYRLLEATRDFALRQLNQADATTARRCLLDYLVTLYARSEEDYKTMATEPWMDLYAADWDNACASLEWAFGPGDAAGPGQALAAALAPLAAELQIRGGQPWLRMALERIDDATRPLIRAKLRCQQANINGIASEQNANWAREAVAICEEQQNELSRGVALMALGKAVIDPADIDPAETLFIAAETGLRSAGHRRYLATCLGLRAYCRQLAGDLPAALALAQDCLALARDIGCRRVTQEARAFLADLAFASGQTAEAITQARAVIASSIAANQTAVTFYAAMRLTGFLIQSGDWTGIRRSIAEALLAYTGDLVPLSHLLSQVALAAANAGNLQQAARILGFVMECDRTAAGKFRDGSSQVARTRTEELIRAGLASPDFDQLLAEGAAWTQDHAIAVARAL